MKTETIILAIIFSILIIILTISIKLSKKKKTKKYPNSYRKKSELMSDCEQEYFKLFLSMLGGRYIVQPQVPLSAIIVKEGVNKYQSELNRVIDFVIFTTFYEPLVAVEINDKSHKTKARKERDKKVKNILNSAKMPLITIWTDRELNVNEIRKFLISSGVQI